MTMPDYRLMRVIDAAYREHRMADPEITIEDELLRGSVWGVASIADLKRSNLGQQEIYGTWTAPETCPVCLLLVDRHEHEREETCRSPGDRRCMERQRRTGASRRSESGRIATWDGK